MLLFCRPALQILPISAVLGLACLHADAGWIRVADSTDGARSASVPDRIQSAMSPLPEKRVPFDEIAATLPLDDQPLLITVTDRPGLHIMQTQGLIEQGKMFARIVALFERRDMMRDRIMSVAAVAARSKSSGYDPASLTEGNNFSAIELARFFELARQQHIDLTPAEHRLLDTLVAWKLLREEGGAWRAANAGDFLVTLPGLGNMGGVGRAGTAVDAPLRAAILSHELGHWQYFSDPAYARACRSFWWHDLRLQERVALTGQLTRLGYDARDDIVIDELQAYLLHTPEKYQPFTEGQGPGAIHVDVSQVRQRLRQRVSQAGARN
jgi:hypothetical protein